MDLEKRAPSQGEEQNWSSHEKGDQEDDNDSVADGREWKWPGNYMKW